MRRYFIIIMVVIVGIICGFGIFGPFADARLTRNVKLIEDNLPIVSESVNTYATDKNKLPDDLTSLKLTGDSKKLVTDNLVIYKKDVAPSSLNCTTSNCIPSSYYSSDVFYYQLCVTYKKASTYQYASPMADTYTSDIGGYSSYVSTSSHPAGEKCYKIMTSDYNVMPMPDSKTETVN